MEQTRVWEGFDVQELVDSLKQSMLLSPEDMDRAVEAASTSATDARSLARWLVTAGFLTGYQVAAVCNRNYAGLRIGNYDILDRLGAGGMGTVFKARHRRMKRVVALKVLLHSLAQDDHFVQRFQREVETIARLSHPNIVMAFDADEDDAGHFLVMEYVEGRDLSSLVRQQGPLGVSAAVECVRQAACGLEYAHKQGMIHRDIKPDNLLLDVSGVVKVADLGLARFNNPAGPGTLNPASGITQAGGILGTANYMAPEQAIDSTGIDHLADVYSLGATLYFLLLGQPPYEGATVLATLLKHRDAPIPSLTVARADVPTELDAVFRRMVAKAPADRFPTMSEVVAALEGVRASPGDTARTPLSNLIRPGDAPGVESRTVDWQNPPASQTSSEGDALRTINMKPPGSHWEPVANVLLVEPSRTQSGIIRKYLQDSGARRVVAVSSGQDALRAAHTDLPDVIVSSLHLPDMTGLQLARQVRGENMQSAPGFVLISSEAEGADAGSLSDCGKAVLLQKPFAPEQLLEALRLVSRGPQPSRAGGRIRDLRVLIADDSVPARTHVRGVLVGLGLSQFVEVADGAGAVAEVAKGTFDLIVTDYNMPYMDGRGLVAYLKNNPSTAPVPIIMVTTETDPAKLDEVRRLGVAAVCDKTFPAGVVRNVVDQLVRTA
jgi:serine/threonine protein kinase